MSAVPTLHRPVRTRTAVSPAATSAPPAAPAGARRTPERRPALPPAVLWTVRLAGAALLGATGAAHVRLWAQGYRDIAVIGPLFLVNAVLALVLLLALLATPARWLGLAAAAGALLEVGTLGGLLLSLTVGLFGFVETWQAPLVVSTVAVEAAGTVLLGGFAVVELVRHRAELLGWVRARRGSRQPGARG